MSDAARDVEWYRAGYDDGLRRAQYLSSRPTKEPAMQITPAELEPLIDGLTAQLHTMQRAIAAKLCGYGVSFNARDGANFRSIGPDNPKVTPIAKVVDWPELDKDWAELQRIRLRIEELEAAQTGERPAGNVAPSNYFPTGVDLIDWTCACGCRVKSTVPLESHRIICPNCTSRIQVTRRRE